MTNLRIIAAVCLVLHGLAGRAGAQELASSFEQLAVLVKPGDKITVLEATGTETAGRLQTLSRDMLMLATPAGPRRLAEADVLTISQRRGDPVLNGAIIGAVAGAAYFATMLAIFAHDDGGGVIVPTVFIGGMTIAGMGAAAGAGIDALITRRQVIYQQSGGRTRVSLSPVFGHGRRGAAVTVRF